MGDYHKECDPRNKIILLDVTNDAPTDEIKTVIKAFDVDKDPEQIYKAVNNFLKPALAEAAKYLKIDTTGLYKEDLVRRIISKLNSILLDFCLKCSTYFAVKLDAEPIAPSLVCACGQHCHSACYTDLAETIIKYPGIIYQCSVCMKASTPNSKVTVQNKPPTDKPTNAGNENDKTAETKTAAASDESTSGKGPIKIKVVNSFNLDLLQARYPRSSYPVCEDYKRSNCRHGRLGHDEVDGQQCRYLHPKKCFKWCRKGKYGCTDGEDCEFWHPLICKNSIRYKRCLDPDCTFTHLQNTIRYERRNSTHEDHKIDRPPRSFPVQSTKEASDTSVGPWKPTTPSNNPTKSDKSSESNSVHFLAELIQSLRKDMDSMKIEMKSEIADFKKDVNNHPVQNNTHLNPKNHNINPQHMQPNHLIQRMQPQLNTLNKNMYNMQNPEINTQQIQFDPSSQRIISQFHLQDPSMHNMQPLNQQMLQPLK